MRQKQNTVQRDEIAALSFLSVTFLLGSILGFLTESCFSSDDLLQMFWQNRESLDPPTLRHTVWVTFRWPIAVLILRILPAHRHDRSLHRGRARNDIRVQTRLHGKRAYYSYR